MHLAIDNNWFSLLPFSLFLQQTTHLGINSILIKYLLVGDNLVLTIYNILTVCGNKSQLDIYKPELQEKKKLLF